MVDGAVVEGATVVVVSTVVSGVLVVEVVSGAIVVVFSIAVNAVVFDGSSVLPEHATPTHRAKQQRNRMRVTRARVPVAARARLSQRCSVGG